MELDVCEVAPNEWARKSVQEVCTRVTSGGTPSRANKSFYSGGTIPWLKTKELPDGWIYDTEEHITEDAVQSSSAKWLAKDAVIMAMYGATVGKLGLLGAEMTCNQACCVLEADEQSGHFRYLYFQLLNAREQIESLATGAAQQNLSAKTIKDFTLPFPPLPEQRAIASVLGALDDKIEVNRKIAATLEEMARAIFTSWFVRFDPVRAKAEGRQPEGMDAATAALFPDRLALSELGEVPEGWEVLPFDQAARFLNGLALQKFPPTGTDDLPVIKIRELRSGITANTGKAGSDIKPEYVVEDGDLLFSWSGTLEVVVWTGGRGALNQHLFKVTSERFPQWFIYQWLLHHLAEFRATAQAKATTMGHIQRRHLSEAMVVVPSEGLLEEVAKVIAPAHDAAIAARLENVNLAAIRDTLLPKLMSGEVRVSA